MKRVLGMTLALLLLLTACGKTAAPQDEAPQSETPQAETPELETPENGSEEEAADAAFVMKLAELAEDTGIFASPQSGVMHTPEDEWLEPYGILTAAIRDFDGDGQTELLVIRSVTEAILLDMYEYDGGAAVLADSMPFAPYADYDPEPCALTKNEWMNISYRALLRRNGAACDILCESSVWAGPFADGGQDACWIVRYDGTLQYVAAFTGSLGSDLPSYTGYHFENGAVRDRAVYYSPWPEDESPYGSIAEAVAAFYDEYGIRIEAAVGEYGPDSEEGFFAGADREPLLDVKNTETESDYESMTYSFTAENKSSMDLMNLVEALHA